MFALSGGLYPALAQSDVTQPGDAIIASSSNTPGTEGVANAIDGQPTKYLNMDMHLIPLTPSGCGLGFLAGSPTDQILARDGWQGERLPQEAVEQ